MKLNHDCIRSLLLTLEDCLIMDDTLNTPKISLEDICQQEQMKDYTQADIAYTTQKLKEADFLEVKILYADGGIFSITYSSIKYDGCQFLETVRDSTRWKNIKSTGEKVGDFSISALCTIAQQLATDTITKLFI